MNKHPEEIRKETQERLKLQDELIARKKRLRTSYEKNRSDLLGVQSKVADVLKPAIDPLKNIEKKIDQQSGNQVAIPQQQKQYQYFQAFNVNPLPIPDVTDKLNAGIRPGIYEINDQYQFRIGKKKIDINFKTEIIDIGSRKINLTQDLMNLINGDDGEIIRRPKSDRPNNDWKDPDKVFTKYEDQDYIDYYDILVYVKGTNSVWGERLKMLEKKVQKKQAEEIDEISALNVEEELLNNISQELLYPEGSGLPREKVNEILDKVVILISAKKEGHNNLDDKIDEILDRLKKI